MVYLGEFSKQRFEGQAIFKFKWNSTQIKQQLYVFYFGGFKKGKPSGQATLVIGNFLIIESFFQSGQIFGQIEVWFDSNYFKSKEVKIQMFVGFLFKMFHKKISELGNDVNSGVKVEVDGLGFLESVRTKIHNFKKRVEQIEFSKMKQKTTYKPLIVIRNAILQPENVDPEHILEKRKEIDQVIRDGQISFRDKIDSRGKFQILKYICWL